MNFICAVNILLDVRTHAGILNPYEQSVSVGILFDTNIEFLEVIGSAE